ncbi:MAG: response regulator [Deltaproteobacteria bacterium]|nr:response regulator [Deltaproteobacteria bacterium]
MRNIAIIDDDASERLVLKGLVEESGFTVVGEGADGVEAVKVCERSSPDLVIMDVKMPLCDGIEAAAEIQRNCPTPVVLLTASADAQTVRRAAEAGVMAYLMKPVRQEELGPAIELAISRFKEFEVLRRENNDLKKTLLARKTIEKAKGLLMEREKLSEGEAFSRIRKISMDKRKTMTEIAEVIILAFEDKL